MRQALLCTAAFFLVMVAWSGWASEREAFSPERFTQLQEEEALVLIDVWAKWCPTCARQEKILADYQRDRPDTELHILVVDFDEQKKWVKHFRAPRQSTFLLYHGSEQVWFSVAETDSDRIYEQLDAAASRL